MSETRSCHCCNLAYVTSVYIPDEGDLKSLELKKCSGCSKKFCKYCLYHDMTDLYTIVEKNHLKCFGCNPRKYSNEGISPLSCCKIYSTCKSLDHLNLQCSTETTECFGCERRCCISHYIEINSSLFNFSNPSSDEEIFLKTFAFSYPLYRRNATNISEIPPSSLEKLQRDIKRNPRFCLNCFSSMFSIPNLEKFISNTSTKVNEFKALLTVNKVKTKFKKRSEPESEEVILQRSRPKKILLEEIKEKQRGNLQKHANILCNKLIPTLVKFIEDNPNRTFWWSEIDHKEFNYEIPVDDKSTYLSELLEKILCEKNNSGELWKNYFNGFKLSLLTEKTNFEYRFDHTHSSISNFQSEKNLKRTKISKIFLFCNIEQ